MSTTLSETSTFTSSIEAPDNGESPQATAPGTPSGVVTVQEFLASIVNRTRWLHDAAQGALLGGLKLEVGAAGGVTTDGGTVVVGEKLLSIHGLTATITPNSPARWLYLYVHDASGATLAWSTTGPDAAGLFKSGDASYRYLGALRIYDDGGPSWATVPSAKHGNMITYVRPASPSSNLQALLAKDISTGGGLLSLADAVPPTAKYALCRLELRLNTNSGSAAAQGEVYAAHGSAAGIDGDGVLHLRAEVAASTPNLDQIYQVSGLLALDGSQQVRVGRSVTNAAARLLVEGYVE